MDVVQVEGVVEDTFARVTDQKQEKLNLMSTSLQPGFKDQMISVLTLHHHSTVSSARTMVGVSHGSLI